jgi:UDP-4-amino-4,6-dideoxy-N-acetyl-beta-L-altrosamine N-acetyltransferase
MIAITSFFEGDKDVLFRWINDPEIVKFNSAFRPISWDEHCAWWESLNSTADKRSFSIRSRADNRIIGTVQLMGIHPIHQHAEVSIRIGDQSDRERGAGTQALKVLIGIAFSSINLRRIFTHVWSDNHRAIKAYAKAGFAHEGTMPKHVFIQGEWKDVTIMGINATE